MPDLKKQVEALLFSSGKRMNIEEISKLCHAEPEDIKQYLIELKKEYEEKDSSLMLIEESNFWKLTVREKYLPIVQKIVTETELSKTILETLAVIAFKYPILQSDLIKIRTNKSYDHLNELEEAGYISRQKQGRTKLIKLTEKFFKYFDLPKDKLNEQFKDFGGIAKAIEEKEQEIEKIKEEQIKRAEEAKNEEENIKQAARTVDEEEVPLKTYESEKSKEEIEEEDKPKVITYEEKLGNLKIVDEPPEEELKKDRERLQKIEEDNKKEIKEKKAEKTEQITEEKTEQKYRSVGIQLTKEMEKEIKEKKAEKTEQKYRSVGIQLTKEMEKEVDRKVEEMLHPPKEEGTEIEKKEDLQEKNKKIEEEPKDLLEAAREEEKKKKEEENKSKSQQNI